MRYIYSIRDKAAEDLVGSMMYILFVFKTDAQAIRYFADAMADEQSILGKHPEDYQLIKMGEIADDNEIKGYEAPHRRIVMEGASLAAALSAKKPLNIDENPNYGG